MCRDSYYWCVVSAVRNFFCSVLFSTSRRILLTKKRNQTERKRTKSRVIWIFVCEIEWLTFSLSTKFDQKILFSEKNHRKSQSFENPTKLKLRKIPFKFANNRSKLILLGRWLCWFFVFLFSVRFGRSFKLSESDVWFVKKERKKPSVCLKKSPVFYVFQRLWAYLSGLLFSSVQSVFCSREFWFDLDSFKARRHSWSETESILSVWNQSRFETNNRNKTRQQFFFHFLFECCHINEGPVFIESN